MAEEQKIIFMALQLTAENVSLHIYQHMVLQQVPEMAEAQAAVQLTCCAIRQPEV